MKYLTYEEANVELQPENKKVSAVSPGNKKPIKVEKQMLLKLPNVIYLYLKVFVIVDKDFVNISKWL